MVPSWLRIQQLAAIPPDGTEPVGDIRLPETRVHILTRDLPIETVRRCYAEEVRAVAGDRKSTRLNSSHIQKSRMPSSA